MKSIIMTVVIYAVTACATVQDGRTPPTEKAVVSHKQGNSTAAASLNARVKKEGIVCERRATIGSRMTRKVCTTAAQREKAKLKAAELANKVQNRSLQTNGRSIGDDG